MERTFSLSKHCYGMNRVTTKLEETQLTSICIRSESVQDSEANTLCAFAFVPILVYLSYIRRHYNENARAKCITELNEGAIY